MEACTRYAWAGEDCLLFDFGLYTNIKFTVPSQEITEDDIDFWKQVQEIDGDITEKSEQLRSLEKQKRYPPRLILWIRRSPEVQQDLETTVSVNGVVTRPGKPKPVGFTIIAPAPPGK